MKVLYSTVLLQQPYLDHGKVTFITWEQNSSCISPHET